MENQDNKSSEFQKYSQSDIEEIKESNSLVDYLEQNYDCKVRSNKIIAQPCPFCDSSDAFSANWNRKERYKCFSCGANGDIINFIMEKNGCAFSDAMKQLGAKDLKSVSQEEREARRRQRELKRAEEERKEQTLKEKSKREMKEIYLKLKAFKYENINYVLGEITKVIPIYNTLLSPQAQETIFYCPEHESVVIAIVDENEVVYNLKYRTKKGMNGKWISYPKCSSYPFLSHVNLESNKKVFITEGEKDAMCLQSIGLYAISLGGVSYKFSSIMHLLKDKKVYLCFDNDVAGFRGMLIKYNEIKNIAKKVYCLPLMFQSPVKGYDIFDLFVHHNILSDIQFFELTQYDYFIMNAQTQNFLADYIELDEDSREILEVPNLKFNLKNFLQDTWAKNIVPIKSLQKDKYEEELKELRQLVLDTVSDPSAQKKLLNSKILKPAKQDITRMLQVSEADRQKAFIEMTEKAKAPIKVANNHAYVYNGAFYAKISDNGILYPDAKNFVITWQDKACDKEKSKTGMQVEKLIRDLHIFPEEIALSERDARRYIFLNGALDIKSNGSYSFSEKFSDSVFETFQLPYEYDPSLKPHKFLKALKNMIGEDDIKTLQEFMGYCLTHTHSYESFMLFYGIGNSGKSVVANLLRAFFHHTKVSHVSAHELKNPFLSSLNGMHLNIGGEINARAMDSACVENIKLLCSNTDNVSISGKYEKTTSIPCNQKPKLIFSCNELPRIGIMDSGFFRRLLVIEFKNSIPKEKVIRDFSSRFLDEKSALFNFALEGLKRLSLQGGFTLSENSEKIKAEYKDREDSVASFLKEKCDFSNPHERERHTELYNAYKVYCDECTLKPIASTKFKPRVENACKNMNVRIVINRTDNRISYVGVKLL